MLKSSAKQAGSLFPPVFQVFEHGTLRVGDRQGEQVFTDKHFQALATLADQTGSRYFKAGRQSIRFTHFVGMLATPFLNVEILPKLDRQAGSDPRKWQKALIGMLCACRFVRPEVTAYAQLADSRGQLLDWYLRAFVEELQGLVRAGLLHRYTAVQENRPVWKGKLLFAQQLKYNYVRRERFFVQYDQYNDRHPANLLIGAALQKLSPLTLPPDLKAQLNHFQQCFPRPDSDSFFTPERQEVDVSDRKLTRYLPVITMARHILQGGLPDIRAGAHYGLALLFDMNQLFEEYLYRQLLRWKPASFRIERQQSRVFWGRNRLRPDLVLTSGENRWVLDTKWRLLPGGRPTADELRQIYVYCDYFKADRGILIFPRAHGDNRSQSRSFAPLPDGALQNRTADLYFADVLKEDGLLNHELGRELYTYNLSR